VKTCFKSSFIKDLRKISDPEILASIEKIILKSEKANSLQDIPNLKPIKGVKKKHFRIRVSSYRIGLCLENDTLYFVRCLNRKDIYKLFP